MAPDGTTVLVAASFANEVAVVDTRIRTVTATLPAGDVPKQGAAASGGHRAYVTNALSDTVTVLQF